MEVTERITIDPEVLAGKPVVNGTRLSVSFILNLLAGGWSEEQILDNYPRLHKEDIKACLAYAATTIEDLRVYPDVASR